MSRSYKKHAVTSCTTSASEKNDKRMAHRVFRKRAKRALKNNKLSLLPFRMRDVSNIWCFAKDGKVTGLHEVLIRFFHGRLNQRAKSGIFISAEYWNDELQRNFVPKFRLMNDQQRALVEELTG